MTPTPSHLARAMQVQRDFITEGGLIGGIDGRRLTELIALALAVAEDCPRLHVPPCAICRKEQTRPGSLLFDATLSATFPEKLHVCLECTTKLLKRDA